MSGGYDLAQLPLHLPPHDGESIVSWLCRLSVRYDVPARDLIRAAGSRQPVTSTPRAAARLRNNRIIGVRLGLTPDEARAQQRLHDWAPGSAERAVACGTAVTHRIGFQALAELLDATLSRTATDPFDLYTDPADLGPGLAAALGVLDQPDLERAAVAAWMLPLDGTHAPTRPVLRIAEHHYNPLLAAIQLAGVREQLPPAEQLTFRTGHPAPRYPTATTPKTRCRLRLPDHHPSWPEPDPAWIPQTLWWNTTPAPLLHQSDPALRPRRGSMLAMILARTGTTHGWDTLGADLHLPASHAHQIEEWIADTRHTGTWPILLTGLERLLTGLQQHPPPINYPARRRLGDHLDLITDAVHTGLRRHPSPVPFATLVRQFWERFTGGDITYAPELIRLDPATVSYSAFRQLHGVASSDLFHVAHRHLQQTAPVTGPLSWRPGLLPCLHPGRRADSPGDGLTGSPNRSSN